MARKLPEIAVRMMKKLLLALTLLLALFSGILPVGAQSLEGRIYDRVNMRTGPGASYDIMTVLPAGMAFQIDGQHASDRLWVHGTAANGYTGWVAAGFVIMPLDALEVLPVLGADAPVSAPGASAPVEAAPVEAAPVESAPASQDIIANITPTARQIFERGLALGNRANVFSKVGDSITFDTHFLNPIGWGQYQLRGYASLQPVIDHFMSGAARTSNSFANTSVAVNGGWTTNEILAPSNAEPCLPGESRLVCEYRVNKPALALIMIGTNDVALMDANTYRSNLNTIVQTSIDMGVIPVISTLPRRSGYDASITAFNQVIEETAAAYGIPLWRYGAAMESLPSWGLSPDGIHPSFPPGTHPEDFPAAADFTPDNLTYGYTLRNLTALQVLDAVWRGVMA